MSTQPQTSGARHRSQRGPKARACAECKRHKIKCDPGRGGASCSRCVRMRIECAPHDPIQRVLDDNESWKSQATAQIAQLQAAVTTLLQRNQCPDLANFTEIQSQTSPVDTVISNASAAKSVIAPIDMRGTTPDREGTEPGLVQAPMSNLYELAKTTQPGPSPKENVVPEKDLISLGIVSTALAEQLLARFLRIQNPLLWGGILFPYRSLDDVRRSSVLLSTVLFTIAALHSPPDWGSEVLQRCYDAFVSLVSRSSLSRNYNIDDVRALCLGAFYLPNLSWRLSGQATRMAAEMDVHQSFQKVIKGDMRHVERVRLWYALFVCDRHFSSAYLRPSAMSDDAAIRGVEQFLECPSAGPGDARICAQVSLFKILSEAQTEFGTDQSSPLSTADLDKLGAYNIAIEQWRRLWEPRSLDVAGIGSYPSQGCVLYYHFARFQLNSLSLRGISWPDDEPMSLSRREAAIDAISAAMSTLTHILSKEDIRRALNGVPILTHSMVAMCATLLLKVVGIWSRRAGSLYHSLRLVFDPAELISLTRRSADLLAEVSLELSEKHLTRLVVSGIREMLRRVDATNVDNGLEVPRQLSDEHYSTNAAIDFAAMQMSDGTGGMAYNMDIHSLAGLLEYGSDQFLDSFAGPNELGSWDAPI